MAGGAVAGILIGNNVAAAQRGIAEARESWRALEPLGLTLQMVPATGLERPLLSGAVGGRPLEVRVRTDLVHFPQTVVVARRVQPLDGRLRVHPSPGGVLGYLRSVIGQDIEVGDEAFDAAFLITGSPEQRAPSLLVPGVRERLVALLPVLALFECETIWSRVVMNGVVTSASDLEHAVQLVVAGATWVA